jgi:hypothetical protein
MNQLTTLLMAAALAAVPVFGQTAPQLPRARLFPQLPQMPQLPQGIPDLAFIDGVLANTDALLAQADASLKNADFFFQGRGAQGRADAEYERGMRALDDHKYDDAVRRFDAAINSKSPRVEGALYWKAYALNRLGRRDDALTALAQLRRDYPKSAWLNDAQGLETELRQGSGQPVAAAQDSDDLKLLAISSLMNGDPERAIPLLEGILKGNSSPKVKDRALFVLTQNQSPQAQQLLMNYAKGAGNPDLQLRALRYIGMSGAGSVRPQLLNIYNSSGDAAVKGQIIQSLMISGDKDALSSLAKSEKDQELRSSAIRQLGAMHAVDQLVQLYSAESSPEIKREIIRSLFVAGASDKLLEIVRNEKDAKLRSEALRSLAMTNSVSGAVLAGLYASEADPKVKRDLITGLFTRGDAKLMIDLARRETDPALKRTIVQHLAMMHSKEATDYMLELLK